MKKFKTKPTFKTIANVRQSLFLGHLDHILQRTQQRDRQLVNVHNICENRFQLTRILHNFHQLFAKHPNDHVQVTLVLFFFVDQLLDHFLVAKAVARCWRQWTSLHCRIARVALIEHVHKHLHVINKIHLAKKMPQNDTHTQSS